MPKVTVLTTVKNGLKYLPATMESIQQQSFSDWEHIVIDDCSSDGTLDYLQEQSILDKRIHIVTNSTTGGPWIAANVGLAHAQGEYIVRIDADDVAVPERIKKQIDYLESNPNLEACGSYAQICNENLDPIKVSRPIDSINGLKWELMLRCSVIHSTACVRRSALDDVYTHSPLEGYYRELGKDNRPVADVEDYRMWARLSRRNVIGIVPEVLIKYRHHSASVSFNRREEQLALTKSVLKEHIQELLEINPSDELIMGYIHLGLLRHYPIGNGVRLMDQWAELWKSDPSLSPRDRNILHKLYISHTKRFLRGNAKKQPISFLFNLYRYLQRG